MKIELFLDDIDRDIFQNPDLTATAWRDIYKDLGPWMPTSYKASTNEETDALQNSRGFKWKGDVLLRREQTGGLMMLSGFPEVYRLDDEAFEAITILWAGKGMSYLSEKKFSDNDKLNLVKYLNDLKLIEMAK